MKLIYKFKSIYEPARPTLPYMFVYISVGNERFMYVLDVLHHGFGKVRMDFEIKRIG